jgi:hypothetical protein
MCEDATLTNPTFMQPVVDSIHELVVLSGKVQGGATLNTTVGVFTTKKFKETVKKWTDK